MRPRRASFCFTRQKDERGQSTIHVETASTDLTERSQAEREKRTTRTGIVTKGFVARRGERGFEEADSGAALAFEMELWETVTDSVSA